jgi:hypothetical protein
MFCCLLVLCAKVVGFMFMQFFQWVRNQPSFACFDTYFPLRGEFENFEAKSRKERLEKHG